MGHVCTTQSPKNNNLFKNKNSNLSNTSINSNFPTLSTPFDPLEVEQNELPQPHYLAAHPVEELSKNFRFFVTIYGIKCMGISTKYSTDSSWFVTINWDDYSYYKKTHTTTDGFNPKWTNRYQFQWTVNSLSEMSKRQLILSVYKEDMSYGQLIGHCSTNLLTVATGPIHHDLRLITHSLDMYTHPHIIFDISMSQICQLIINPIEILVHIYDNLEEEDEENEMENIIENNESPHLLSPSHSEVAFSSDEYGENDDVEQRTQTQKQKWENTENQRLINTSNDYNNSDEHEHFRACWQISFIPTGVDNPAEYFSKWTTPLEQPYWNTVDHSLLPDNKDSQNDTHSNNHPIQNNKDTQIDNHTQINNHNHVQSNKDNHNNNRHHSIQSHTSLPKTRSSSSLHRDQIDKTGTYHKLAALCKQGRLVKSVLSNDFPTLQLITSIEQLRQNHLRLNLYSRQFPFKESKFFGETWLPFFKIYDAEVVDQTNKHFFDSYFVEKIWFDGKCIGHVEGIIVFQNNPIFHQMYAGVHSDIGYDCISPPILGAEHKSINFNFSNSSLVPPEIVNIASRHKALLQILYSISQHDAQEAVSSLTGVKALGQIISQKPDATMAQFDSVCDSLLKLLKKYDNESTQSFTYTQAYSLLTGQRVLLNLANHVLEYIEIVHSNYRTVYCSILHNTLRRGEIGISTCLPSIPEKINLKNLSEIWLIYQFIKDLKKSNIRKQSSLDESPNNNQKISIDNSYESDLPLNYPSKHTIELQGFTTFSTHQLPSYPSENSITTNNHQKGSLNVIQSLKNLRKIANNLPIETQEEVQLFHKRMKLCRQYFLLLHRMLYYALNKLCSDTIFQGQGKYVSIYQCFGYFRLPVFRDEFLSLILTEDEMYLPIDEWRGTEYDLDYQSLTNNLQWNSDNEIRLLFDWSQFHNQLRNYFGEESLIEGLKTLTEKSSIPLEWKQHIRNRGPIFFYFLEQWSRHVYQSVSRKELLKWQSIPGYLTLLKAFLLEMKLREVEKYPDSLLNCSGAMLANEKLLSVFIKVLFLKTSVYKTSAVFSALNYIDYWLQILGLRKQNLPTNFDFNFFRKGLDIILSCDICLNVSKGIWFLYKNLPFFQGEHLKVIVIDLLLRKYFITLFLNWSWLVRRCYMWIIFYRICEGTREILGRWSPQQILTIDQKIILLAYSEIARWLKILNAPEIFLSTGLIENIPIMLTQPINILQTPSALNNIGNSDTLSSQNFRGGNISTKGNIKVITNDKPLNVSSVVSSVFLPNLIHKNSSKYHTKTPFPTPSRLSLNSTHDDELQQQQQQHTLTENINGNQHTIENHYNQNSLENNEQDTFENNSQQMNKQFTMNKQLTLNQQFTQNKQQTLNKQFINKQTIHKEDKFHKEIIQNNSEIHKQTPIPNNINNESYDQNHISSPPSPSTPIISELETSFPDPQFFSTEISTLIGQVLPTSISEIPRENSVYLNTAIKEFHIELERYKKWVLTNDRILPELEIPSSPLDNNIDVPLDNW